MTDIFRTSILKIVLNDDTILQMLGDGANSVLPHAGYRPPIPVEKLPGIELQIFGTVRYDTIQMTTGFRWRVYDDPSQGFTRIDRIIDRLMQIYPSERRVAYDDPVSRGYWQRLSLESQDTMDDGFTQHCRWVEWQVWRALP